MTDDTNQSQRYVSRLVQTRSGGAWRTAFWPELRPSGSSGSP